MTLSPSVGRQTTIGELIRDAWISIGIVEISQAPSEAQMAYGRRKLDRILDSLQTEGVFARTVRIWDIALFEGESTYTLPVWVSDVSGVGSYIDHTQDSEHPAATSPIEPMSREDFQRLGDHDVSGPPTSYWVQEDIDPLKIHFWPRPNDDGVARMQFKRHLSDIENDQQTIDLPRYWMRYLEYALCVELCAQTSQQRPEFVRLAEAQLVRAKDEANEKTVGQFYLDHEVC